MKADTIKKLSPYDVAMIGRLYPMTQTDMKYIMLDKGDIEIPASTHPTVTITIGEEFDDSFELPKGKSMKAADRRKRTYHKQQQREKKYRDLGYPIERFSASERGKMREGVGVFPETLHMNSMYNRNSYKGGMCGSRKEDKTSIKKAVERAEHETQTIHESNLWEYELDELYNCIGCCVMDASMYEDWLNEVLAEIEEVMSKLTHLNQQKEYCLNAIEENRAAEERLRPIAKEIEKKLENLWRLRKLH